MEGLKSTILIADDQQMNRVILREVFGKTCTILEAENGTQALEMIKQYRKSLSVVLLDIIMPEKDGYQVLQEMDHKGYLDEVPVIVITALNSTEDEIKAFDLGASDIIVKPFEPYVVKRRVQNIIELNQQKRLQHKIIEKQSEKLREANDVMVDALSSIIEYRSLETGQHVKRMRLLTKILLENLVAVCNDYELSKQDIDMIASASAIHDVGKIAIPEKILNKEGALSFKEFEKMKLHTTKGSDMIYKLEHSGNHQYLQYAYDICRYHHERWDGKGYPGELQGADIPVWAQVVGVADCYDALTHDRVYAKAVQPAVAINMILNGECGIFSPQLLECLKNVRDSFIQIVPLYIDGEENVAKSFSRDILKRSIPVKMDKPSGSIERKYESLLKYMDSTVMEVDFESDIYHVVYIAGQDFMPLRSGRSFKESIENFVHQSVHPHDQNRILRMLREYVDAFFEDEVPSRSRRYRVFDVFSQTYFWYRATILRVDSALPQDKKALIIWSKEAKQNEELLEVEDRQDQEMIRHIVGGIQRCKVDRYFTMTHISVELAYLLGYTLEEIKHRFANQYIQLIYPPDRDMVVTQFQEQRRHGDITELVYRLETKQGEILWFLDKSYCRIEEDGEEYVYFVLIDMTKTKKREEELRLLTERYQVIMRRSNDIMFEWDVQQDKVLYYSQYTNGEEMAPIVEHASQQIMYALHVHPDDLASFIELTEEIRSGEVYRELELRLEDMNGHYRWYKLRMVSQKDSTGVITNAMGVMACIDEEKRSAEALHKKADHDSLTKLYNKGYAVHALKQYLSTRDDTETAALFIIDVDDFKNVNDTYGHMFGDKVLKLVSIELTKLFRNEDMIARIGGDEFLVLMKNIRERDIADMRAAKINRTLRDIEISEEEDFQITCSIGVAICPDDGVVFNELFQHSDLALYTAKAQGKNKHVLYDTNVVEQSFEVLKSLAAARTDIDSE